MVVPLAMGWRHLLFENYPVAPAAVAPRLPDGLDVDTHDGSAWLSVVPFTNVALRPRGAPDWAGVRLPELNVRTYVTCDGAPGVYFFSLDAQGVLSVLGARLFHHLPYYYARIRLRVVDGRVQFRSRRRHPGARAARYAASYGPTGEPFRATDDPLAEFLLERYRLFTEGYDGDVRVTAVEHEPWTVQPATAEVRRDTMLAAAGFATPDAGPVRYYRRAIDVVANRSRGWRAAPA